MNSLTTTEAILGIIVATVGIQLTVGGVISRVLWSQFNRLKTSYEQQLAFQTTNLSRTEGQRDRAERLLGECQDDLDQCRERVHDLHEGIRG